VVDDAQWLTARRPAYSRSTLGDPGRQHRLPGTREVCSELARASQLSVEPLGRRDARIPLESVRGAPRRAGSQRIIAETRESAAILSFQRARRPSSPAGLAARRAPPQDGGA
jgi:hypothetical protein